MARVEKLDDATTPDLQKALPADAALVDYLRYTFFEWDNTKPVGEKFEADRSLPRVRRDTRQGRAGGTRYRGRHRARDQRLARGDHRRQGDSRRDPAKVRELVWEKVREQLPANTKTVYVCPDQALCRMALPEGAS